MLHLIHVIVMLALLNIEDTSISRNDYINYLNGKTGKLSTYIYKVDNNILICEDWYMLDLITYEMVYLKDGKQYRVYQDEQGELVYANEVNHRLTVIESLNETVIVKGFSKYEEEQFEYIENER